VLVLYRYSEVFVKKCVCAVKNKLLGFFFENPVGICPTRMRRRSSIEECFQGTLRFQHNNLNRLKDNLSGLKDIRRIAQDVTVRTVLDTIMDPLNPDIIVDSPFVKNANVCNAVQIIIFIKQKFHGIHTNENFPPLMFLLKSKLFCSLFSLKYFIQK
jgi:hypothetical protein